MDSCGLASVYEVVTHSVNISKWAHNKKEWIGLPFEVLQVVLDNLKIKRAVTTESHSAFPSLYGKFLTA